MTEVVEVTAAVATEEVVGVVVATGEEVVAATAAVATSWPRSILYKRPVISAVSSCLSRNSPVSCSCAKPFQ